MKDNPISDDNNMANSDERTTSQTESSSESKKAVESSPGIFSMLQSVLAAMVGIQSEEKRQKDFESGHAGNYIFIGIVMVLIFIFTLIKVVDTILANQ